MASGARQRLVVRIAGGDSGSTAVADDERACVRAAPCIAEHDRAVHDGLVIRAKGEGLPIRRDRAGCPALIDQEQWLVRMALSIAILIDEDDPAFVPGRAQSGTYGGVLRLADAHDLTAFRRFAAGKKDRVHHRVDGACAFAVAK